MDLQILFNALSIVLIDLLLGGDNAVVIALAVRGLPPQLRKRGILAGAGVAVALRIVATFFAAQLLHTKFVQLVGGILILWIAVKLFSDAGQEHPDKEAPGTIWRAISFIVVADITMSLDNVLAIAAASHGSLALLIFGLGLSIPLVIFTSSLLSNLMDRYPIIVYAGAAILGKVGAEMILTDSFTLELWHAAHWQHWVIEGLAAVAVLVVGRWMARRSG